MLVHTVRLSLLREITARFPRGTPAIRGPGQHGLVLKEEAACASLRSWQVAAMFRVDPRGNPDKNPIRLNGRAQWAGEL